MQKNTTTKPPSPNYFRVPRQLWRIIKRELPKQPKGKRRGRPRVNDRDVINGIWYVLWTGCQWKAVHRDWFNVSSSVLHERFQTWQQEGRWERILSRMVRYYARKRRIAWKWQSIDSKSVPAPLGGSQTGKNPTDRGKRGSKIHILVDQRGAPLAVYISGANQHDKWFIDEVIFSVVVRRPTLNSTCVRIKDTTTRMCMSLLSRNAMSLTSSAAGDEANHRLTLYLQAKHNILPDVGLWSERWAGWRNGAVSALDGARKPRITWLLFYLPVLLLSTTSHFSDRF